MIAACIISPFLCRAWCMVQSVDVIIQVSNRTGFTESLYLTFVLFVNCLHKESLPQMCLLETI